MAIETLSTNVTNDYNKEKERLANSDHGCRIYLEEEKVHVTIPIDGNMSRDLVFSKTDMRKLLEELFVS